MSTRPHFERRPANPSAFAQLRLNVYMAVLSVVLSPVLYVWNIVASKKAQQAVYGALWLSTVALLFSVAVVLRSIELGNSALLTWVLRLLGVDYPFPKGEGDSPRCLGGARPLVESPKPQPQQLSTTNPADPVVQVPSTSAPSSLPLNSHVRAVTRMTYPHITQTSDYESDDGEHSQCHPDFLVRPLHDIGHEATSAEQEDALTSHSERHDSVPLTSPHLRTLDVDDDHSLAQRQRSDSTAVTVSSGTPYDSPGNPTEPIVGVIHESPVSEHISMIEESDAQPDEPIVVHQRPPVSPEALPPPYVSPPSSPPTASKEPYAFRSPFPPQNGVIEAGGPSSSESSANEESVQDAQPERALGRETLTVPSNPVTMELVSPVESEVFVYPVDSSPPELVPVTMVVPDSPEDDVFLYPTADPAEPTPTGPVEPIAPAPRRAFRDHHSDLEDTPSCDPAPAYRPHSPHLGSTNTTVRSHRYSLTADMLPAPEIFSPVPLPVRASALPSARTATRESPTPSRISSIDHNRYSPRPRQTSSPAPLTPASVTVEDVNDASSDLGDASATGALGDARKKRRRKKNSKTSRRSVVFSDDEPEVIGSASDWAMESGEESGTPATPVNQLEQRFSRQMSLPPVSSPLARSSILPVRDSEFSSGLANLDKADVISATGSVDSRGPLPSYRDVHSPGSSRAASPAPSIGSVGSNADGDWSARKVDAYGRWYQAMNKHQPVPQIPKLKQEMTACSPDELAKRLKLGAAAPPTKHTPILLGAQHGAGRGRFKSRR